MNLRSNLIFHDILGTIQFSIFNLNHLFSYMVKVKGKVYLCLTKYHVMKTYPFLN